MNKAKIMLLLLTTLALFACKDEASKLADGNGQVETPQPVVDEYLFKSGATIKVELLGPAKYSIYKSVGEDGWLPVKENLDRNYTYQVPEDGYYAVVGAYDPSQIPSAGSINGLNYEPIPFYADSMVFNGCSTGLVEIDGVDIACKAISSENGGYITLFIDGPLFNASGNFDYMTMYNLPHSVDGVDFHQRSEFYDTTAVDSDVGSCLPTNGQFPTIYKWYNNGNYVDIADNFVPVNRGGVKSPSQFSEAGMTQKIYEAPRWSIIKNLPVCTASSSGACEDEGGRLTLNVFRMNGFNMYEAENDSNAIICGKFVHSDPYGDQRPTEVKGGLDVVVENVSVSSYTLYKKVVNGDNVNYVSVDTKDTSYKFTGLDTETTYALVPKDGRTVKFSECDNIVRVGSRESCEVEIYRDKNFRQVVIN